MKKEVFLAIAIGFALGLVITFGIWTANKSLKNLPSSKPTPTPVTVSATPSPAATQANQTSLTLSSPADEALVTTNKVTVSGKASPQAVVVILSEDNQQILTADAKGEFTTSVTLVPGYNSLRVQAYDPDGNMTESSALVTYTTAKIWNLGNTLS